MRWRTPGDLLALACVCLLLALLLLAGVGVGSTEPMPAYPRARNQTPLATLPTVAATYAIEPFLTYGSPVPWGRVLYPCDSPLKPLHCPDAQPWAGH